MPTKKKVQPTQPTSEESNAAVQLQMPIKPAEDSSVKNLFKSARSLVQSGIKDDDSSIREYWKPVDFFGDSDRTTNAKGLDVAIDGTSSKAFVITNAIKIIGKFGPMARLSVTEEDESESWVSLSLGKNENALIEERMKLIVYFRTNTQPIGPVMFVALPTSYGAPFYSIQAAIPF